MWHVCDSTEKEEMKLELSVCDSSLERTESMTVDLVVYGGRREAETGAQCIADVCIRLAGEATVLMRATRGLFWLK